MDLKEFIERGRKMVDFIGDYIETLPRQPVAPNFSAGYLKLAFPSTPPKAGVPFEVIMEDFKKYILPGLIQWQHPGFHAFLPGCSSYSSILGGMLSETLGHAGFDWNVSPAGSELELIAADWYGRLIGLPECFLRRGRDNRAGGIFLRSTTECTFLAIITARRNVLRKLLNRNPSLLTSTLTSSLVVYCSKEAHSSIERYSLMTLVNVRILETENDHRLRGKTIDKAIEEDKGLGLIPFFVNITLGTATSGSCDPVNEIGIVCRKHGMWLHVDASYAGNAMVCPEFRHYFEGIGYASSVSSNPANWMLMHFDCAVMFVKDRYKLNDAVIVDRTTYGYSFTENDWGYPSKTEFRALEFWIVIRNYGIEGMQRHIRNHVRLAKMFGDCVYSDDRFELISRNFGVVCFRLKGSDEMNRKLKKKINLTGELFMTSCLFSGKFVLRFALCTERTDESDINHAWHIICEQAGTLQDDGTTKMEDCPSEVFETYYRYCIP